jgi:hypothetical protein
MLPKLNNNTQRAQYVTDNQNGKLNDFSPTADNITIVILRSKCLCTNFLKYRRRVNINMLLIKCYFTMTVLLIKCK